MGIVLVYKHLQVSVIYSRDTHARGGGGGSCSIKTMLDANDIQVLRQMFNEQEVRLDQKFEKRFIALDQKIDDVRKELLAAMEKGFSSMRDEILDVIEDNIQPQFNTINARITRLERKLA